MRACVSLAALLATAITVAGHPICFIDDKPTDYEQQHTFCPAAQAGACCTDLEEAEVKERYEAIGVLTGDCADLYKEVQCGQCHSYSGHLFALLGAELGVVDGMIMKNDFCNNLVSSCEGQIIFPDYDDGEDYCEKHTGSSGNTDQYWSYPFEEEEAFEPGLNEVFGLSDSEFPDSFLSMKMTPQGDKWWLSGQTGEMKSVDVDDMDDSTDVVDLGDLDYFYEAYEEGLLDFAFGPMFGESGFPDYFYVSYTVDLDDGENPRNRLSRFTYSSSSQSATLNSQEILLTSKPKFNSIHAAGWVGFKPSSYGKSGSHDIYWTTGDGGPQTDYTDQSQNNDNLLGSVIRITVPTNGDGYTVPSGNLGGGMAEICASGFRNPWRCSFDKDDDTLYCGDVGHTFVEEIDIVECGKNYGWSRFEGSRCQEAVQDNEFNPPCNGVSRSGFTFPWFEYCHPDYFDDDPDEAEFVAGADICRDRQLTGHAVIGGYVYRGQLFSDVLAGAYIFGDNVNKNIYFIKEEDDETVFGTIISDGSTEVVAFAEDNQGELYIITNGHQAYNMPCGDLCATTCLDQSEETPTVSSEGCYVDSVSNRALPNQAQTCPEGEKLMSPQVCASHCAVAYPGSVYAGVEYGFECFCGDAGDTDFDKNGSLDSTGCDFLCTSTPEEFCGGFNAIEVFKIGPPEADDDSSNPLLPANDDMVVPTDDTDDGSITYLGCYSDPDGSRSMTLQATSSAMTSSVCASLCSPAPFFGTQYAEECWCGDDSSQAIFEANGVGNCDDACTGNPAETCGGSYAMSVYSTDGTVVTPPEDDDDDDTTVDTSDDVLVGCYSDPSDSRMMTKEASTDSMTAEVCAGLCAGSDYYGTQWSIECWCGDASTEATFLGNGLSTSCDFDCSGDSSEICGGSNAMSVYSADGTLPATGPTPTPEPTPAPVTVVTPPDDDVDPSDDAFVGCYSDPSNARIMTKEATQDDMTSAVCAVLCGDVPYYGTQWGVECWCGDATTEAKFLANGLATCTYDCGGDSSETCGGFNAMSVYSTDGTVPDTDDEEPTPTPEPTPEPADDDEPTSFSYVGCYADPSDDRSMVKEATTSSMTSAVCAGLCSDSPFFGTQWGQECWCGEDDSFLTKGSGSCTYDCSGDSSESCGGFNAMSVYMNEGVDVTPTPPSDDEPTYIGCFADTKDERIMTFGGGSQGSAMSAVICAGLCEGSATMGTQYAYECWCGTSSGYDVHGTTTCADPCTGNPDEICGDNNAMSVYSI